MIQDAHYLLGLMVVRFAVAAKAYEADDVIQFSEAAKLRLL